MLHRLSAIEAVGVINGQQSVGDILRCLPNSLLVGVAVAGHVPTKWIFGGVNGLRVHFGPHVIYFLRVMVVFDPQRAHVSSQKDPEKTSRLGQK